MLNIPWLGFFFSIFVAGLLGFVIAQSVYFHRVTPAQIESMHHACAPLGGVQYIIGKTATCTNGSEVTIPKSG